MHSQHSSAELLYVTDITYYYLRKLEKHYLQEQKTFVVVINVLEASKISASSDKFTRISESSSEY